MTEETDQGSTTDAQSETWCEDSLSVQSCDRCPALTDSRSQIVNGTGPADADLLFVGEAPGANEDEEGEPFVGRSGDVLVETLREAGLARTDIRITNTVRCRPPENRDPTTTERANCRAYLADEIQAVEPELVVTLGKVPAEHLLDRDVAVTSEAGDIYEATVGDTTCRLLLCLHPAATMYDPSQRDPFEATIQTAAEYAGDGGQSTLGSF